MTILALILAIIAGSVLSLVGGIALLKVKKYRERAILLALPFGAGALLAAAFLDLLPEAFELGEPNDILLWTLVGFLVFFLLERTSSWFHSHHTHDLEGEGKHASQRFLIIAGDIAHNAIDGLAIGAAFLVSIPTGIITTIAVSAHEIPKELGTFALLLSRGWKDKKIIIANLATAVATLIAALIIYFLGSEATITIGPLLGMTAGFFIYIAASDIIPDIHEQPRKVGTVQAAMLVAGIIIVGWVISLLHI